MPQLDRLAATVLISSGRGHQQPETAMSTANRIVLDALGKLNAHDQGLFGYCRSCDRHNNVPLPALIAAGGDDSPVVSKRPVKCAAGGGRETAIRITAPQRWLTTVGRNGRHSRATAAS